VALLLLCGAEVRLHFAPQLDAIITVVANSCFLALIAAGARRDLLTGGPD
jgi:hypothetical protein